MRGRERSSQVPYASTPPTLTDLLGSQIPTVTSTAAEFVQQQRGGKIRVIAGKAAAARGVDLPREWHRYGGLRLVRHARAGWHAGAHDRVRERSRGFAFVAVSYCWSICSHG